MRLRMFILAAPAFLVLLAAHSTSGQTTTGTVRRARQATAPYTAEYSITTVQTLANGTTITRESTTKIAVDSRGRKMTSTTTRLSSGEQNSRTFVNVFDPVARTNTNWNSPGRNQVTVTSVPEPEDRERACANSGGHLRAPAPRPEPVTDDLGTATIQGIEAEGKRITRTIPAGADGNDAPLVVIGESWRAIGPNLDHMLVREIIDDPRHGKTTNELTSFVQGDPDPSLFEPPQGYETVNEGLPEIMCSSD